MKTRALLFILMLSLIAAVGCQGKKSSKTRINSARVRGDDVSSSNTPGNASSSRTWGEISLASDQTINTFWNELYYFTYPQLVSAAADDQLGYVDGTAGQSNATTGVRFWGYAKAMTGGGLDTTTSELNIEIYDDRVGKTSSSGGTRGAIIVHIGPKVQGFVSASGKIETAKADLTFEDQLGGVYLSGTISGDYYEGTVSYSNSLTGAGSAKARKMGKFKVKKCGFFQC